MVFSTKLHTESHDIQIFLADTVGAAASKPGSVTKHD